MKGQNAPIPPVELDEAGGGDAIGVPQWMIAAVVSAALTVQPGRLKQGGDHGCIRGELSVAMSLLLTLR